MPNTRFVTKENLASVVTAMNDHFISSVPTATTSVNGLMSSGDKSKLDGIASGANNYSLPTATDSTLGGVKVGNGLTITNGVLSAEGGASSWEDITDKPFGESSVEVVESVSESGSAISNSRDTLFSNKYVFELSDEYLDDVDNNDVVATHLVQESGTSYSVTIGGTEYESSVVSNDYDPSNGYHNGRLCYMKASVSLTSGLTLVEYIEDEFAAQPR